MADHVADSLREGVWALRTWKKKSKASSPMIPAMVRVQTYAGTSTRGAFRRRVLPAYLSGLQELMLHDGRPRKRLVPLLLKEHRDDIVLMPHHQAGAPLLVNHRGLQREWLVGCGSRDPAVGLSHLRLVGGFGAPVAVSAGLRKLLAKVAQQELPAAAVGFRVGAHHGQPGLVHALA